MLGKAYAAIIADILPLITPSSLLSFTRCPLSPLHLTPPTSSKRLCTAPNLNRGSTGDSHQLRPPQQQRDLRAASSSRNLGGVTCAFVSIGSPIMRLYLCLASTGLSRVRSRCPSPKVSSLSLSAYVSRCLRAHHWNSNLNL
jgi:hypothetical protein